MVKIIYIMLKIMYMNLKMVRVMFWVIFWAGRVAVRLVAGVDLGGGHERREEREKRVMEDRGRVRRVVGHTGSICRRAAIPTVVSVAAGVGKTTGRVESGLGGLPEHHFFGEIWAWRFSIFFKIHTDVVRADWLGIFFFNFSLMCAVASRGIDSFVISFALFFSLIGNHLEILVEDIFKCGF